MASEREKQNLDEEEIIDLTEVVEEGPDTDSKKSDQGGDSAQDGDFDEDLNDLFESLGSEDDDEAGSAEGDDDFEDLFNDEVEKSENKGAGSEEQDTSDDDFLKEFLEDDQEDDSDSGEDSAQKQDGDSTDDIDDLISDIQEDDDSDGSENSVQEQQAEDVTEQKDEEPEPDVKADSQESSKEKEEVAEDAEPPEEAQPEESAETDSGDAEVEDASEDVESSDQASVAETAEKPEQGTEVLTEQLESLSHRMDAFEKKIEQMQDDFPDKTVQLMEEKGPELEFMQQALQGVKDELEASIKSNIEQAAQGQENLSEDEFKEQVIKAVEEKGLELNFVQELSEKLKNEIKEALLPEIEEKIKAIDDESQDKEFEYPEDFKEKVFSGVEEKISDPDFFEEIAGKFSERLVSDFMEQAEKLVDEKVSEQGKPDQSNESEMQDKLTDLEARIQDLKIPDEENIKQEIMADVKKNLEDHDADRSEAHLDGEGIEDQIKEAVETKLNALVEEWQSEKKALAGELENALKFWGKMQEKLTVLSQDIGELRDTRAEIDPEMQEKIETLTEQAVTRPELRNLASQLKVELEDYIVKKVPEAAAKVIREEISAIINGAGK
ncbi:MAG: hypothetical protein ABR533_00900 [Desulfonatronovibrio sp.]